MVQTRRAVEVALTGTEREVIRWCTSESLLPAGAATAFAGLMTLPAATELVVSTEPLLHRLVECSILIVGVHHSGVVSSRLHLEFASVIASPWFGSTGRFRCDVAIGLTARFRGIIGETQDGRGSPQRITVLRPAAVSDWTPVSNTAIAYVASAALDHYQAEQSDEDYSFKLQRIPAILGLRPGELATALRVSRQGLRKWETGGAVAAERRSRIDDLVDFAQWLSQHLSPEKIPAFMRRRIPALDNQTPLEWLLAGRLDEFRTIYQRAFSYDAMP